MPSLWDDDDGDVEEQPDQFGKVKCPLCRGFGIDQTTQQHCIACEMTGRIYQGAALFIRDILKEGLNEP